MYQFFHDFLYDAKTFPSAIRVAVAALFCVVMTINIIKIIKKLNKE